MSAALGGVLHAATRNNKPAGETVPLFTKEEEAQLVENTRVGWAPVIEPVGGPALSAAETGNETYRPAVIVHGMGDSGTNAGMKSICATVPAKYPGAFVLCSTTADGVASITTKMPKQLEQFTAEVRSHPELARGFNAVGLSQGNALVQARKIPQDTAAV